MNPAVALLARKEAGALLLSARGLAWLLTVALALSTFALLLVGNTELSLLDNAQAVYDMACVLLVLGALLALAAGIDSVAGERERGSLMPLLVSPAPRGAVMLGKLAGIAIAWIVVLALGLPYLWAVGSTGQNLFGAVVVVGVLGTAAVLGFGFLAMGLAARVDSALGSLLAGLVVLLVSASPVLLGPSLRQSAIGRGFDAANPFSGVLNALDAVVIDSQSLLTQFWQIGIVALWVIGTAGFAWRGLQRMQP